MKLVFFLLLLLPICAHAQLPVLTSRLERICWQENRKLTWRDFQATASLLSSDSAFAAHVAPALLVTGYVDALEKNNFRVSVSLNPQECWVADSTDALAALTLAHEQLHFDICELVARQLRRRIAQAYQAGQDVFSAAFCQEVKDFVAKFDQLEDTYDQQTRHGNRASEQRQWAQRVRRELAQLSRYQSTAATCRQD